MPIVNFFLYKNNVFVGYKLKPLWSKETIEQIKSPYIYEFKGNSSSELKSCTCASL